jgi:hypothetical protein
LNERKPRHSSSRSVTHQRSDVLECGGTAWGRQSACAADQHCWKPKAEGCQHEHVTVTLGTLRSTKSRKWEIKFKISVAGACFGTWRPACSCPKQMSSCSDIAELLHQSAKVEGQSRSGERTRKMGRREHISTLLPFVDRFPGASFRDEIICKSWRDARTQLEFTCSTCKTCFGSCHRDVGGCAEDQIHQ